MPGGHLPVWRQLTDMSLLMAYRRIGLGFYFRAGMYRRDVPMASKFRYRVGSQYVNLLKRFKEPG